jgi:LacI family transcriptional regulator
VPGEDGGLPALLRAHPEITAIIAHNDPCAIHAILTLRQAGWRVPEDISVIGCDDTNRLLDATGRNILTTVRLPLCELGRCTAQLLLDRIAGRPIADPPPILPTQLIVRGTTAPPARR